MISKVKTHLTTDAGQTQEIKDPVFPPIVQPDNVSDDAKTQIVGGSILLGGLMLFAKVLVFAL